MPVDGDKVFQWAIVQDLLRLINKDKMPQEIL